MSPTILWLAAGALFIAVEVFAVAGFGFLFAGIAALLVGAGIELGLLESNAILNQFVLFFILTCAAAALLWKKLAQRKEPSYSNMVGTEATVAEPGLTGNREGQVHWSGTLMRARIDPASGRDVLASETRVLITKVEGNLLFVKPQD
jgi:membrane protein implicated in regulation of membrane protease activity